MYSKSHFLEAKMRTWELLSLLVYQHFLKGIVILNFILLLQISKREQRV